MNEPAVTAAEIDRLHWRLDREAEAAGYHLNPDVEFTKGLVKSLIINQRRYGYWACPCRLASGNKQDDLDIICPCDYREPDLNDYDACYCALYVSEAVRRGSKKAGSIPERRPPPAERKKETKKKIGGTDMHSITASNLRNAHGGESMAHMRYQIWGDRAEQEGYGNVARLFRAIAQAETIHATNHFRELENEAGDSLCASMAVFGLGSTSQNLQGGINGETYEITEMYPTFLETAKFQAEKGAQLSFHYALSAERTHAALFQKAKQALDSAKKDIKLGPIQVCEVCGWTHEGDIPDKCPICAASREKFQTFA